MTQFPSDLTSDLTTLSRTAGVHISLAGLRRLRRAPRQWTQRLIQEAQRLHEGWGLVVTAPSRHDRASCTQRVAIERRFERDTL